MVAHDWSKFLGAAELDRRPRERRRPGEVGKLIVLTADSEQLVEERSGFGRPPFPREQERMCRDRRSDCLLVLGAPRSIDPGLGIGECTSDVVSRISDQRTQQLQLRFQITRLATEECCRKLERPVPLALEIPNEAVLRAGPEQLRREAELLALVENACIDGRDLVELPGRDQLLAEIVQAAEELVEALRPLGDLDPSTQIVVLFDSSGAARDQRRRLKHIDPERLAQFQRLRCDLHRRLALLPEHQ
ncbi:MAG: hypothetical protein ACJ752_06525 [Gaiellaceae bacterium]